MSVLPLAGSGPIMGPQPDGVANPRNEREAAQQFEALLIAQLLRSARDSGGADGWLGTGEDRTSESISEYAEQQVAQMLSNSGGFGLADLIVQGLESPASRSSSDGPAALPQRHTP